MFETQRLVKRLKALRCNPILSWSLRLRLTFPDRLGKIQGDDNELNESEAQLEILKVSTSEPEFLLHYWIPISIPCTAYGPRAHRPHSPQLQTTKRPYPLFQPHLSSRSRYRTRSTCPPAPSRPGFRDPGSQSYASAAELQDTRTRGYARCRMIAADRAAPRAENG